jgi:uncharacterized protein YuzE
MIVGVADIALRMTYDRDADAAYIYVSDPIEPGGSVHNVIMDHDLKGTAIVGDFDRDGHLLGIELLGVARLLRTGVVPPD